MIVDYSFCFFCDWGINMNFSQDDNHVDYYWFTKTNQECQSNLTQECLFTVYKRCTISVHSVSNFLFIRGFIPKNGWIIETQN